ncbi:hypothetical protein HAX54_050784, partial [Datura stramonium]|nr:hypothetical protein [Datura stramonium]
VNVGSKILEEWWYFASKDIIGVPFPSLITLLCKLAKVHQKATDVIMACDMPFEPLRVKGALGRGIKKRNTASGGGDGGASTSGPVGPFERIGSKMASMRELLGGLPRPPSSSMPSSTTSADSEGMQVVIITFFSRPQGARRGLGGREKEAALSGQALCPHVEGDQEEPEDPLRWIPYNLGDLRELSRILLPQPACMR